MAKIVFSRKEFEKHIKITKEIEKKISLFGTHLESLTENQIELEILPNRPDLFSMQGFLRSFKAFLGKDSGLKEYKIHAPEKNFKVKIDSSVKAVRPFTACAIVKNLSFNDVKIKEIIDIQEKIHTTLGRNRKRIAIGLYPLEKIILPITYTALAPDKIKFTPLESGKELSAMQILQQHPTGREYAHLLQGFDKFPVFKDAKGNILSMPPIINSKETGRITESTKEIFIECSGSDFSLLKKTLNILITTLAEMGGKIYAMDLEYEKKTTTPDLTPEKIKISLENTNKLLGLELKEKDLEKLLAKMGYDYSKALVSIPAWRSDILHEVDIIEDVAIAYGYENFVPEIPKVATHGSESKENKIKTKISEILVGLGLLETSSYHLIKEEEAKRSGLKDNKIEVENSKNEYKILRPSLVIPALRIFSQNKDKEYPQKTFELGVVFEKDTKAESGIKESDNLIITSSPGNFTEIKQILDHLTKMLNQEYTLRESTHPALIEGRAGTILINNTPIGILGEVHPETLQKWNIKMPIAIIEISLEEIYKLLASK